MIEGWTEIQGAAEMQQASSAWPPLLTEALLAVAPTMRLCLALTDQKMRCAPQGLGVPCFLDKLSPDELAWPEGARYRRRPFDFGKIWWSLRMAELGRAAAPSPCSGLATWPECCAATFSPRRPVSCPPCSLVMHPAQMARPVAKHMAS